MMTVVKIGKCKLVIGFPSAMIPHDHLGTTLFTKYLYVVNCVCLSLLFDLVPPLPSLNDLQVYFDSRCQLRVLEQPLKLFN